MDQKTENEIMFSINRTKLLIMNGAGTKITADDVSSLKLIVGLIQNIMSSTNKLNIYDDTISFAMKNDCLLKNR